jgi:hypothetical protein
VQLRLDGTRTETRFHLLSKRTSPSDIAGVTVQSPLLAAEVCGPAGSICTVLERVCSVALRGMVDTHSSLLLPFHFAFHALPCAT